MNAIELLESQHRLVEDLFSQLQDSDESDQKQELFDQIADALAAHATIEEEIFYPACVGHAEQDKLFEATEEHLGVKRVIADVLKMRSTDERFVAKVKVLQDLVEHHVEEEESELFPKVQQTLSEDELHSLGGQLEQRFAELTNDAVPPREAVPNETEEAAPLPPA
ncbi:MAG TPA: hemerythrin domain-containing protein [Myxococcota bacterium]|jgi:hemerythrin superfamily protein